MLIPKTIRIISYSLASTLLVLAVSTILLKVYLDKYITDKIKNQLSESTQNEYILKVDDLTINILSQSVKITNLIIEPQNIKKSQKNQIVFKAKKIKISELSLIKYLKEKKLKILNIDFLEPELLIYLGSRNEKKSNLNLNSKKKESLIKSLSINHINIKNIKLNILKNITEVIPIFHSTTNNLNLENIHFDLSKNKISEILVVDKFEIILDNFKCNIGTDSLYTITTKKLTVDYNKSIMTFDSLKLIPNYSKNEFAQKAGRQTSRLEVELNHLNILNINYKLLLDKKNMSIHKIELVDCRFNVYRDNRLPLAKIIRPSIQSMIKDIPFLVSVDTIEMKNSKINFEAIHPHSYSTGKISVNKFDVIVTGVQNDSCLFSENKSVEALASGYIMNKGQFNLKYNFPLQFTNEHFYCSGSLSRMPFSTFNSLIIPVKNLQFRSGVIDYISFNFTAEENFSYGTMKFKYHDLKIDMLNKLNSKKGLNQKIKSILANNFKVIDSNPEIGGKIRISKIKIKHNPYRYFLNYSMQSIISGVEPAIMID